MSPTFAPRWLLDGQALDGAGDFHLAPGVHFRLLMSPLLGLPAAPFEVHRIALGTGAGKAQLRTDIRWIDSHGKVLTAPFDVVPDNPVTGILPPPQLGVCIWFTLDAKASGLIGPRPPVVARPPIVASPLASRPVIAPRPVATRPIATRPVTALTGSLRVDAAVQSTRGPGVVATALQAPYTLSATRIERVILRGSGTVTGIQWLDGKQLAITGEPWREMGFPLEGLARYPGIPGAADAAKQRVERGAPTHLGLSDAPDASGPDATDPVTQSDEWARVSAVTGPLEEWLKTALDDPGPGAWTHTHPFDVEDELGRPAGRIDVPGLASLLQSAFDPGIGRWLGLVDVDDKPLSRNPGDVVVYLIRGIWAVPSSDSAKATNPRMFDPRLVEALPKEAMFDLASARSSRRVSERVLARLAGFRAARSTTNPPPGRFIEIYTALAATIATPPARPTPPVVGDLVYGRWSERFTPPDAAREITLPLAELGPGASLAIARREGAAPAKGLNPLSPAKRALPILPAVPASATTIATGTYTDRAAPPPQQTYRVSQADWFGRWSTWREVPAQAGVRPLPPVPVITASYTPPSFEPPAFPGPIPDDPRAGQLAVTAVVPTVDALVPGSNLLAALEVSIDGAPTAFPLPASPGDSFIVTATGPLIARCGQATVTVTARWVDTAGAKSGPASPVTMVLHDPRPPVPPPFVSTLQYTARPDATGRARAHLAWTSSPQHAGFRVFYADETRVTGKIRDQVTAGTASPSLAALLAALDAAPAADVRATVFTSHAQLLPRAWFEQLTGAPLPATGAMRFEHDVSGSLRVLSLYRVVPVSAAHVEAPFADCALSVFAVPNTGAPQQPHLAVLAEQTAAGYRAQLTIGVPRGLVPASEYRLRRSAVTSSDPVRMPIVTTGSVPVPPGGGAQQIVVTDTGALVQIAPAGAFRPFTHYTWRVEVRGPAEPSGPPGAWSATSLPVVASFAPADPPAPPGAFAATASGTAHDLTWEHVDPLIGGEIGGYQFELYRRLPGGAERMLGAVSADADPAHGGRNPDRTGAFHFTDADPVPAGTRYRVLLRDPLGRPSLPATPVVV